MATSLYELFPSLDRGLIADVLHQCSNNTDQAADMLLAMALDGATLVRKRTWQLHLLVKLYQQS